MKTKKEIVNMAEMDSPSLLAARIMLIPTPGTFAHSILLASSDLHFLD